MTLFLTQAAAFVHAGQPVEFQVSVEGRLVRVTIDWPVIERLMGHSVVDTEEVRDFLHRNRRQFALAISARMFAQGIPLNRELALSLEDFDAARALHMRTGGAGRGRDDGGGMRNAASGPYSGR